MALTTSLGKKEPHKLIAFRLTEAKKKRLETKFPKYGQVSKVMNHLVDLVLNGTIQIVEQ